MKILIVSAGYRIFDAKGQLNGFLTYNTQTELEKLGHDVNFSDVTKDYSPEREVEKLLWADAIIYIMPIMWFNMPPPMVKWLAEVLFYNKTFVITDSYGEGGQVPADKFMIIASSNLKHSDLGKGVVLADSPHIDDVLQPLIMTNRYLSIRDQLPTFHADDVIAGDTTGIQDKIVKHIQDNFS